MQALNCRRCFDIMDVGDTERDEVQRQKNMKRTAKLKCPDLYGQYKKDPYNIILSF